MKKFLVLMLLIAALIFVLANSFFIMSALKMVGIIFVVVLVVALIFKIF